MESLMERQLSRFPSGIQGALWRFEDLVMFFDGRHHQTKDAGAPKKRRGGPQIAQIYAD
jgi:hypothetical protein